VPLASLALMTALQWLTALMPVLSVAILLVALRMPAARAMPLALVISVALALLVWQVAADYVVASIIEGWIIAASVVWIVLGAIALLYVMRASGGVDAIRMEFHDLSADSRVQALLIGWLFVCFIEGAAGFGTPAPVAAPLLIALGFRALPAVALTLIADVSAVTFGAVGTPILVGIAQGVGLNPAVPEDYDALQDITLTTAGIDILVGLMVPVAMMWLLTTKFAAESSKQAFREVLPLALVSALLYSIPAWLATRFVGIEFGGILGGLTGMVLFYFLIKTGFLIPKRRWTIDGGYDEDTADAIAADDPGHHGWPAWKVWGPYLLLTILLLASRLIEPIKEALLSVQVGVEDILGTGLSSTFEPLYSPGFVFLIVVIVTALVQGVPKAKAGPTAKQIGVSVGGTALVLAAAVPLVRVFLNSDVNDAGLDSMPLELAAAASSTMGSAWPLAAPFVGALGSFVSGSATFSHLMFASLQTEVATSLDLSTEVVLAQQVGGANAGNMVCVSNVVAVAGVTGLLGQEGTIIRSTALVMVAYTLGFALIGLALA
jgi:lactate permease